MKPSSPSPVAPPAASSNRRGIVVMLLSVAGFTVNTLLLKYLGSVREIPSLLPLLFRSAIGIVIVLAFFRGRRPTRITPVFREPLLIWRGLTGLLGTAAYYWTVPSLGAGKATLFCNTYAIFAALIAALWLGEALTWRRFGLLSTAFAGIVLLAGPSLDGQGWSVGTAELVALGGAIMAAASVVLIRQLTIRHSIGTIYLSQCVWILVPMVLFTGRHLGGLETADLVLLIIAGIAAGYGQLAMNEGYRCLTVTAGASLQMLWPVLTAIGGLAWFDERFAPLQVVGAVLILVSAWLVSTRRG